MSTRIQVRRDTSANWASANPTLAAGEIGLDTTLKRSKIGDGSTAWASLAWEGEADYAAPRGKAVTGAAAPLPYYNAADYGMVADSGTTDNRPILAAMLAAVPAGAEIVIPPSTNGGWYGFDGTTIEISKPVTIRGNWGRATSGSASVGTVLRPDSATSYSVNDPIFRVTGAGRIKFAGLILGGRTTAASVGTTASSTTVTVPGGAQSSWVGCPISLATPTSGGAIPQFADRLTTIVSVNTEADTMVLSEAAVATGTSSVTIWTGRAIDFEDDSHESWVDDCHIYGFARGLTFGAGSDHIMAYRSVINGNYDNAVVDTGNENDFAFIGCNIAGGGRASLRFAPEGAENVSLVRTHLGFSPYGIVQDATGGSTGISALSMVASPIEQVTEQHICIVNGGNIDIDAACYWAWGTGATPTKYAFQLTGLQNYGPIHFRARLVGTDHQPNPNCPAVIAVGSGQGTYSINMNHVALNGFAVARFPFTSYTEGIWDGQVYFNGSGLSVSSQTPLNLLGRVTASGRTISSSGATTTADNWARCTGSGMTLTLTQTTSKQFLMVTNESSGAITVAVSAGTLYGPTSLAAGHGATFISDGTNWRCVGTY